MNPKEFTAAYLERLQQLFPETKYTIEGDLSLKGDYQGKEVKHYLDNAYREYQKHPENFEEIVQKYGGSISDLHQEFDSVQVDAIVPIIKPMDFLDSLRQLAKENGQDKEPWVVYEQYNDQLLIVYAEDTPKSIRYFPIEEFEKLGLNKSELRAIALENLKRMLPEIEGKGTDGLMMLTAGGDYEASLILLEDIWASGSLPMKGDVIVGIPNRDMIVVSGSEEGEKLEVLKNIVSDSYQNGSHSLSPYLFKWDGTRFVRYVAPADKAKWN